MADDKVTSSTSGGELLLLAIILIALVGYLYYKKTINPDLIQDIKSFRSNSPSPTPILPQS